MPIIWGVIVDNHTSTGCIRRPKFQLRCDDLECVECAGVFLDLTYVWSVYVAPLLAKSVLGLLPKKNNNDLTNFGNICPSDIDWEYLGNRNRKFYCQNYTNN